MNSEHRSKTINLMINERKNYVRIYNIYKILLFFFLVPSEKQLFIDIIYELFWRLNIFPFAISENWWNKWKMNFIAIIIQYLKYLIKYLYRLKYPICFFFPIDCWRKLLLNIWHAVAPTSIGFYKIMPTVVELPGSKNFSFFPACNSIL